MIGIEKLLTLGFHGGQAGLAPGGRKVFSLVFTVCGTVLGHEMSESLLGGYTSYIPIWLYRAHVRAVWTEGKLWRCVLPQTWLVRLPPLEASFEWSHVFSMCLHSHPCVCSDLCIPLYFVRACPVSPLIGTSVEALSPSVAVC